MAGTGKESSLLITLEKLVINLEGLDEVISGLLPVLTLKDLNAATRDPDFIYVKS